MQFITFFSVILLIRLKIYLSNYIVKTHSAYFIILNNEHDKKKYALELIRPENNIYFDTESNSLSYLNNIFYYLTYNDTNWKHIISSSYKFFTIYFEDINTFLFKINEIIQEKLFNRIIQIIIGCNSTYDKKDFNFDIINTDINIFINKEKDEIKEKYSSYSNNLICSTYIEFLYSGDVYADNFIIFAFIFIFLFILIWIFIHYKARRSGKYLFIHSYIIAIFIFYFLHSLFYFIITMKTRNENFDEKIFSGALYNTFCFFQFFTKLFPALFATIQLNLLEIREHFQIIRNSKVIHILSANIFFVILLENNNQVLSEILNGFFYILILICLIYMFFKYKNCLEEKYLDAIMNNIGRAPTLKYKMKLLYKHLFSVLIFALVYFIILFISKKFFSEYRTFKFIIAMINYSDLLLILILCVIHFPRELPPNYIEDNNLEPEIDINIEENEYFENIYEIIQTEEEKYFENYNADESANIVIIKNPFNENKIEVEIEKDEIEEEEDEKEKEVNKIKKEKEEYVKNINREKNEKNYYHIETTEEESNENKNNNNIINKNNKGEICNKTFEKKKKNVINDNFENEIESNKNNEDENKALVDKEDKKFNIVNQNQSEEDILDIYHTKIGYIEIS